MGIDKAQVSKQTHLLSTKYHSPEVGDIRLIPGSQGLSAGQWLNHRNEAWSIISSFLSTMGVLKNAQGIDVLKQFWREHGVLVGVPRLTSPQLSRGAKYCVDKHDCTQNNVPCVKPIIVQHDMLNRLS